MEMFLGKIDVKFALKKGDTGADVRLWQKAMFVYNSSKTYAAQDGDKAWITTLLASILSTIYNTPQKRWDLATRGYTIPVVGTKITTADLLDGDFGSYTDAATRRVQSSLGVPVDGTVGPATLIKWNAWVKAASLTTAAKDDLTFTWVGDGAPGGQGTGTGGQVTPLVKKGLGTGAFVALLAAAWFVFRKKGRK